MPCVRTNAPTKCSEGVGSSTPHLPMIDGASSYHHESCCRPQASNNFPGRAQKIPSSSFLPPGQRPLTPCSTFWSCRCCMAAAISRAVSPITRRWGAPVSGLRCVRNQPRMAASCRRDKVTDVLIDCVWNTLLPMQYKQHTLRLVALLIQRRVMRQETG